MSQCVPSWDFQDISHNYHVDITKPDSFTLHGYMTDFEVAELTWENGQLAFHGLGQPCAPLKPNYPTTKYTWDKPSGGGTLESIVNQATTGHVPKINNASFINKNNSHSGGGGAFVDAESLVPWFEYHCASVKTGGSANGGLVRNVPVEALVPSRVENINDRVTIERGSCHVTNDSINNSAGDGLMTLSSFVAPESTFSGKSNIKTTYTVDDYGSNSLSGSQQIKIGNDDKQRKRTNIKSSISTKASRTAAVHNQSERKRRDKINQNMKTLQKMIPNSNKTDKASMLDEVIEYLKQLQSHVNMVKRMNMSSMMLPSLAMQQHLQMSMMNPLGMSMDAGVGMGMGNHVMDMNGMMAPMHNLAAIPLQPTAFLPLNPWDGSGVDPLAAFAACQSQPMTMDGYMSNMASLYQQPYKPPEFRG